MTDNGEILIRKANFGLRLRWAKNDMIITCISRIDKVKRIYIRLKCWTRCKLLSPRSYPECICANKALVYCNNVNYFKQSIYNFARARIIKKNQVKYNILATIWLICIKDKCLYLHKRMYSVAIFSFNNKPYLQVFNTCKKRVRQMETHIVFIYTFNSPYHCFLNIYGSKNCIYKTTVSSNTLTLKYQLPLLDVFW